MNVLVLVLLLGEKFTTYRTDTFLFRDNSVPQNIKPGVVIQWGRSAGHGGGVLWAHSWLGGGPEDQPGTWVGQGVGPNDGPVVADAGRRRGQDECPDF